MISLIIPVYKNEESIPDLIKVLDKLYDTLLNKLEVIFVVDGSPDRCYEILSQTLPRQRFPSVLAILSKNFGSFAAIRAGLTLGDGEYFSVMAADLQEPPEMVGQMYCMLKENEIDVVVGVRDSRKDPFLTRIPAQVFWALYRRFIIQEMPPGGVDVFACNRKFRDVLLTLEERHSSLIAQIFWLGFRRRTLAYNRQERVHGKSAWTFRKKVNYLMDSVFSFTDLPIRILIRVGTGGAILAFGLGALALLSKAMGLITLPGYALTMFVITFLGALNLLGLGVVGSYAWRTYENTKARPLAIPLRIDRFKPM